MIRNHYEHKDLGKSFALTVICMVVASLLLSFFFPANVTGWKFWLMQALYTVAIGSSAFIYATLTKTKVFVATKLNKPPRILHIVWGCVAVVFLICCMTPLNNWLLDAIEKIGFNRPSVDLEDNVVGLLIVACLIPCVAEEIVFRGTVAQSLEGNKNKLAALAISGALFSVFHANPAQTIHQFVLGAFLTLLVFRSGSIWTSVVVHFFNNAMAVVLSYTPIGEDVFWIANGWWLLIVGVVGFVLCVFGYLKTTNSIWQKSEYTEQQSDGNNTSNDAVSNVALWTAVGVCALLWIVSLFL